MLLDILKISNFWGFLMDFNDIYQVSLDLLAFFGILETIGVFPKGQKKLDQRPKPFALSLRVSGSDKIQILEVTQLVCLFAPYLLLFIFE